MRTEIKSLTSLRGIAAMAVVAMHYSATMQDISSGKFPSLAPHGSLAVDVFFVLSGFIMAYTYLQSFQTLPRLAAYSGFLVKRVARILPLNIAVTALVLGAASISIALWGSNPFHVRPGFIAEDFFTNALMLPGLGFGVSVNWPAWSISVEFVAYLLFPALLALTVTPRPAVAAVVTVVATAGIVLVCLHNSDLSPGGIHNHPYPWRDLLRCMTEFCFGLIVYRAYASRRLRAIVGSDTFTVGVSVAIIAIIGLKLGDLFAILLFPFLIWGLSVNTGRINALLETRLPYFLGTISYSLYLVHESFRGLAQHMVRAIHPAPLTPLSGMLLAAAWAVAMIFPAWLSFIFIERPGRRLVRTFLIKRGESRIAESKVTAPQ